MRNRERIRQMKGYTPERIDRGTPVAVVAMEEDPILQRYSSVIEQYPQVGLHISAVEQLSRKKRHTDLSVDQREALLVYSLWTEDPGTTTEIAQEVGLDQRGLNRLIDTATYELDYLGDSLLDIVNNLRRPIKPADPKIPQVSPKIPEVQTVQIVLPQNDFNPQSVIAEPTPPPQSVIFEVETQAPAIPREVLYRDTERTPLHGTLAQSYDHPILESAQERTLFGYLKSGATVQEVRQDSNFIDSFDTEDMPKIIRILDQSATVEEAITSCYLRLVDVIARSAKQIPLRDAINSGNMGLVQAARKWEPREQRRFSTYAVWAVRSAVQQEQSQDRSSIRIPSYVQQDMSTAKWITDAFQSIFGRTPSNEELRQQLLANTDMPRWRVNTLMRVRESKVEHVGSINTPISPDGDGEAEVGDFIADTTIDVSGSVVQKIANEELRRETRRALKENLTPEEQRVIKILYGLDDISTKTPEELAQQMQTTPERVIDIERRSLGKLRYDKWLRDHWAEDPPAYVYGRSAESAAFRLGLFDGYKPAQIGPKEYQPVQQAENPFLQPIELPINGEEGTRLVTVTRGVAVLDGDPILSDSAETNILVSDGIGNLNGSHPEDLDDPLKAYKVAFSTLSRNGMIIAPEEGETLEELYASAMQAADEIGKKIKITRNSQGQLFVEAVATGRRNGKKVETMGSIKELRDQGLKDEEIAQRLGIAPGTVRTYSSILIRDGELTAHKRGPRGLVNRLLEEESTAQSGENERRVNTVIADVRRLRNEGYNNQEIATMLGRSYGSVAQAAIRLIRAGEIEPLRPFGHEGKATPAVGLETTLADGKSRRRTIDGVRDLKLQGLDHAEIAQKLGIALSTVNVYISKLRTSGQLSVGGRGSSTGVVELRPEQPRVAGGYDLDNSTIARVKQLRNQGLFNDEIALALGVSKVTVGVYASQLIQAGEITPHKRGARRERDSAERAAAISEATELVKQYLEAHRRPTYKEGLQRIFEGRQGRTRGKRPATVEFENQVKELRLQGLTYYKIADKLGTNWMRVQNAAYVLIRAGELQPTRTYTKEQARDRAEKIAESREFREEVKTLALQGLNSIQIAERLEDSVKRVHFVMWKMDREGTLTLAANQLRPSDSTGYVDRNAIRPTGEHYDRVTEMRNQGMNNREIAKVLGLPVHRVEIYASNLIRAGVIKPAPMGGSRRSGVIDPEVEIPVGGNYERVEELRNQGLSNQQVAQRLGIAVTSAAQMASKLIRAGRIESLRKNRQLGDVSASSANISQKIVELRTQGYGNTEIAERLGEPRARINTIAHELIKAGQIKPLKPGRQSDAQRFSQPETTEAYAEREPYRQAIAGLVRNRTIEILPVEGESLEQIKYSARKAANDLGKQIKIANTVNGTILLELSNK